MKTDSFSLAFLVLFAIYFFGIFTPNMRRLRRERICKSDSRPIDMFLDFSAFIGWQVLPLVYIFSSRLDGVNYERSEALGWVGVVALSIAVFLYWRAYSDLGMNWSPRIDILENQQLVDTGIYKHIRHPVYAAMFIWCFANPLLLPNWIAGFAMIFTFLPLYMIRVPREEAMMTEHFGEKYVDYMRRTARLVPRLFNTL